MLKTIMFGIYVGFLWEYMAKKILQTCHTFWHGLIPQSPPDVLVKSPTNSLDITTLPRFF